MRYNLTMISTITQSIQGLTHIPGSHIEQMLEETLFFSFVKSKIVKLLFQGKQVGKPRVRQ